jgi:hypothetical protein
MPFYCGIDDRTNLDYTGCFSRFGAYWRTAVHRASLEYRLFPVQDVTSTTTLQWQFV